MLTQYRFSTDIFFFYHLIKAHCFFNKQFMVDLEQIKNMQLICN